MKAYEKYYKVTIKNLYYETGECSEVHNRVKKSEIQEFLNSFKNQNFYFEVEHLTQDEFERTEQ